MKTEHLTKYQKEKLIEQLRSEIKIIDDEEKNKDNLNNFEYAKKEYNLSYLCKYILRNKLLNNIKEEDLILKCKNYGNDDKDFFYLYSKFKVLNIYKDLKIPIQAFFCLKKVKKLVGKKELTASIQINMRVDRESDSIGYRQLDELSIELREFFKEEIDELNSIKEEILSYYES